MVLKIDWDFLASWDQIYISNLYLTLRNALYYNSTIFAKIKLFIIKYSYILYTPNSRWWLDIHPISAGLGLDQAYCVSVVKHYIFPTESSSNFIIN